MRLHHWAFATEGWRKQQGPAGGERNADAEVVDEVVRGVGAYIMGRRMFGGGAGPWDETWRGYWGEDPPYRAPVFVLTHHPREPLAMRGGTTFTFVTDGIESALEQARNAAGDKDVTIAGGASAVRSRGGAGTSFPPSSVLRIDHHLTGVGARLLVAERQGPMPFSGAVAGDFLVERRVCGIAVDRRLGPAVDRPGHPAVD